MWWMLECHKCDLCSHESFLYTHIHENIVVVVFPSLSLSNSLVSFPFGRMCVCRSFSIQRKTRSSSKGSLTNTTRTHLEFNNRGSNIEQAAKVCERDEYVLRTEIERKYKTIKYYLMNYKTHTKLRTQKTWGTWEKRGSEIESEKIESKEKFIQEFCTEFRTVWSL